MQQISLFLGFCFFSFHAFCTSPFLPPHDVRLSTESTYIEHDQFGQKHLQTLGEKLKESCTKYGTLPGLAAPQIGVFERLITIDLNAEKKLHSPATLPQYETYVNPQIIWKSKETSLDRETSCTTHPFAGIVPRHNCIKLCAYTVDGEIVVEEFSGALARTIQQMIDHLDGIRFPDRIESDEAIHVVTDDMKSQYEKQWMDWNITVSKKEWEKIKKGEAFVIPVIDGPQPKLENDSM